MIQFFYRMIVELTNGRWSSFLLKNFAQSRISRFLIPSFAKAYKINLDELEQPLKEYGTLHDFFIRRLKKNSRPIHTELNSVVSPVDAVVEDIGLITADLSLQIKGKEYSLIDMLGSNEKAASYQKGAYVLLYLSPSNYHRIHSPVSGTVNGQWTLGKKSYPVNRYGLKYGREALSKNYRKITEIEHEYGITAVVKVGAMFVNSIEMIHQGEQLQKGEEMAYFSFGSTVILLFTPDSFEPFPQIATPQSIRMGEGIGTLKKRKR